MPSPLQIIIATALINLVVFAVFGIDKFLSRSGKRRVPEKTLIVISLLAASPGALLGMVVFNHKTSKPLFRYGVPIITAIHAATSFWLSFG